ncbi:MAG TPA: hypothetical protein VGS14_06130 [Actinomycetes bacterium]|nr:hypothetical protein [Actinomycetes bacterium]
MTGGRRAWCPRCDELRAARPGAACPVCGRRLLTVPPARPGQPQPRRVDRAGRRLRALLSAVGVFGVALLVVAAVASAFAAGRLSRTTPSAQTAAPAATVPGLIDERPDTVRRDLDWRAQGGGLTITLRSITVGTGFSRLELHVTGVTRGREISGLEGLRVRDGAGKDLLPGGGIASISTAGSRPASQGGIDTEVVLDRTLDQQAVATVELRGLIVARHVEERVRGTLVDRELQRKLGDNLQDPEWLSARRDCPACRLRLACQDCRTVRLAGSAYRRGLIMVVLQAVGRLERSVLNPSSRRVTVTDDAGISELSAWIDGSDGTAVVSVRADQLAAVGLDAPAGDPLPFEVVVQAKAEETVQGAWTISQQGGLP